MKRFLVCMIFSVLFLCGCAQSDFSEISDYMPAEQNDVGMQVKTDSLDKNRVILLITNNTDRDLNYGEEYILEKKRDGKWYSYTGETYFNGIGIVLGANSTNECEIAFPDTLDKGEYRIIKAFSADAKEEQYDVEFTIE